MLLARSHVLPFRILQRRVDSMPRLRRRPNFFARKTSHVTGLLQWVVLYLLLVQVTMPGLVLCFGSNGHSAVETTHSSLNHSASQSLGPCLDGLLLIKIPEEQTLGAASGSASQALGPVWMHVSPTRQECVSLLHFDALQRLRVPLRFPSSSSSSVILQI